MDIYFNKFPLIYYIVDINNEPVIKVVRDITVNVRLRKEILENASVFEDYYMDNGETPEIVADKYYGSPLYQWVVMLCNQRYNLLTDYPMDNHTFERYLAEKYQSSEVPIFTSNEERDVYIHLFELDPTTIYKGKASDAQPWQPYTRYRAGTILSYGGNYYRVVRPGTTHKLISFFKTSDAVDWVPYAYFPINTLIKAGNFYYVVEEEGTSGELPPNHVRESEYNGTLLLRSDIPFLEEVTILDVDTTLKWAIFPTEHGALDYVDRFYNKFGRYGREVKASTRLYHLHHFEDLEGHIINYLDPEPTFQYQVDELTGLSYVAIYESQMINYAIPIDVKTKQPYSFDQFRIVTNFDYEVKINEQKRYLKLISKTLLFRILEQLKEAIS